MRWLLHAFGIYLLQDWFWATRNPNSAPQWQPIVADSLLTPESESLWLRPGCRAIQSGWYLFAIRHCGDNPRATGWLRSGVFGIRQGRPMYPIRKRLRIVHVNRNRPLFLELERVTKPLEIQCLRLIRLPLFDAIRRLKLRLKRSEMPVHSSLICIWRTYNQLLNAQAARHALISYERWQQQVEVNAIESLSMLQSNDFKQFVFQELNNLAAVDSQQWVVLLRPGSQLSSWALRAVAQQLDEIPVLKQPVVIYGDEDCVNTYGVRHSPRFKPAWNRELFWSDPAYSNHWFVRGDYWNQFIQELHYSDWWNLQYRLLADVESCLAQDIPLICHLPMILSHGIDFNLDGSTQALKSTLARDFQDQSPTVLNTDHGFQLQWAAPAQLLLSVIIPTRDHLNLLQDCLLSLQKQPPGCDLEVIVIDNGSVDSDVLEFLSQFSKDDHRLVIRDDGPFNYSALNNRAALQAHGSVLLLLNNDVEILSPQWGHELASQALRPGIGCVGAQLRYPDGTIQHAGVVLGIGGMASHAHRDFPHHAPGYASRLQLAQEFSAVTAACLAISRVHWDQLGGLDAEALAVNYNDVDLCLRAKSAGLRNLYLPQVQAVHHESKSRGRPQGAAYRLWRREWAVMEHRWRPLLMHDPSYSPCLTLEDESWNLSFREPSLVLR